MTRAIRLNYLGSKLLYAMQFEQKIANIIKITVFAIYKKCNVLDMKSLVYAIILTILLRRKHIVFGV